MSASAIKPTMPGVGSSPPTSGHSILPMNAIAQKVVPGTESSASMKPLNNSAMSYVTLQPPPAQQPLSLVQEHNRTPAYSGPAAPYNNTETKPPQPAVTQPEPEKIVANGVESSPQQKPAEAEPEVAKEVETSRNNNLSPETPSVETAPPETPEPPTKVEEKKATTPVNNGTKSEQQQQQPPPQPPQQQPQPQPQETTPKKEEVKPQPEKKTPQPTTPKTTNESTTTKSDIKIATTPRAVKRKSRELKDLKGNIAEGGSKPKRNRVPTQPYQSPLPEFALIAKTMTKTPANKNADDKLIVFYKNEFLAVRNSEGSFFVCQAMQNIYKSSRRIRIRWLSQDKNNGEIYSPDFYDLIDFDCILTNLNLNKVDKNKYQLTKIELLRTENILKRAIDVEAGISEKPSVTEEHPDGLDLSLYTDESQLKRRKNTNNNTKQKQRQARRRDASSSSNDESSSEDENDKKRGRKQRGNNKALAIAKSVAKVPVRNKRTRTTNDEKRNETKKTEVKKAKTAGTSTNNATRTKLRGTGDSTEGSEKNDKTTAGRAKRLATTTTTTTGTITNTEESTSRKKSRSSKA